MINTAELVICKRRGHDTPGLSFGYWEQCKFCKMWIREVRTIEEREDEPPASDRSPLSRARPSETA